MLNPFAEFEPRFIPALRKINKRFLVSQFFTRHNSDSREQVPLLLTSYSDEGQAKLHYKAMEGDKFAAILDLENASHREKLDSMLNPQSGYRIYSSYIKDPGMLKKAMDEGLKKQVNVYITKHTDWKIGRDKVIRPEVELSFGELYMNIRFGSQKLRVKLEEIEGN